MSAPRLLQREFSSPKVVEQHGHSPPGHTNNYPKVAGQEAPGGRDSVQIRATLADNGQAMVNIGPESPKSCAASTMLGRCACRMLVDIAELGPIRAKHFDSNSPDSVRSYTRRLTDIEHFGSKLVRLRPWSAQE